MSYHFSKKIRGTSFEDAVEAVTESLKAEGFGVLTDVDVKATFHKKLGLEFRNYRILGACNPNFAHQAISAEPHIGVFLPCSVVVQEYEDGTLEASAVDPVASMMSVHNPRLEAIAQEVQERLKRAIDRL